MTHIPSDVAVDAALDKWLREPSDWRNWKEAAEIRNQFRNALLAAYAVEPPYIAGLLRGAEIVEAGRSGEFQRDAILEAAARRVRAEAAQPPLPDTGEAVVQAVNELAKRFADCAEQLEAVTTRPTPHNLYYAVKNDGEGTGWRYVCVDIGMSDVRAAANALTRDAGEAARAVLKRLEWGGGFRGDAGFYVRRCPMCGFYEQGRSHSPTCELARALEVK